MEIDKILENKVSKVGTFLPSAIHCIIWDLPRWYPTVPGCVREDRTTEYLHLGSAPRQYPLVPRCVLNSLAPALYLHSGFEPSVPCGAQYNCTTALHSYPGYTGVISPVSFIHLLGSHKPNESDLLRHTILRHTGEKIRKSD